MAHKGINNNNGYNNDDDGQKSQYCYGGVDEKNETFENWILQLMEIWRWIEKKSIFVAFRLSSGQDKRSSCA